MALTEIRVSVGQRFFIGRLEVEIQIDVRCGSGKVSGPRGPGGAGLTEIGISV